MQFHCIDFGGGSLHQFEAAARGVGRRAYRHRAHPATLAEMRALFVDREATFRTMGIASIAEFRARRAAGRLPAGMRAADVFLIVDNWGALRAELEDADARSPTSPRGPGVGVHLVLTTSRWTEIRPALRTASAPASSCVSTTPANRRSTAGSPRGWRGRCRVGAWPRRAPTSSSSCPVGRAGDG